MPRKARQTITGQPAQPISPVPGQMYGMGVEQQRLAEALPTPAIQPAGPGVGSDITGAGAVAGAYNGAETGQPTVSPEQARVERYQQAVAAAQQLRGAAGILTRPTDRPDVPVTNGISSGPGAGPEILARRVGTPTGRRLRELSQLTGDPIFQQLAERARL